jgi:hypothetical protein
MHEVHTLRRLGAPFTSIRTLCKLMFQRRLVYIVGVADPITKLGAAATTSHTFAISERS